MNTIERTLIFKAPLQKVWHLVGTAEGFQSWFQCQLKGLWAAGQDLTLVWKSGNANEIRLTALDQPDRMAYQWHPGQYKMLADYPEAELTTVTFRLKEVEGGTEVNLTETGFENIPDERRLEVIGMNTAGWDEELEQIRIHAEA